MRLLLILLVLLSVNANAKKWKEADYVNFFCKGEIEYRLPDKTRVDCLTSEYAIEYDFDYKWAEPVAQAIHYSIHTGKKAGIVLIMSKKGEKFLTRLNDVIDQIPCRPSQCPFIKVWTVEANTKE